MGSDPDIPNRPILYQNPSIREIMGSDPDIPNRP